jgi:hypothetical protein
MYFFFFFLFSFQGSLFRFVQLDSQQGQASCTLSLEICKPCLVLEPGQVRPVTPLPRVSILTFLRCFAGFWEVGLDPQTGRVVGLF